MKTLLIFSGMVSVLVACAPVLTMHKWAARDVDQALADSVLAYALDHEVQYTLEPIRWSVINTGGKIYHAKRYQILSVMERIVQRPIALMPTLFYCLEQRQRCGPRNPLNSIAV